MASRERINATVEAHCVAVGHADADAVASLYADDAAIEDPAGGDPVRGVAAIRDHFAHVLTERRDIEIVLVAVAGHHAAVHLRATPAGGPARDVIDTMSFDDEALITSMQAYAA